MFLPGFQPSEPAVSEDGAGGDEWYTPKWLLDWLPPVQLDPCHSASSLVQAAQTFDIRRGDDGLTASWAVEGTRVVWVNPPFSATSDWLYKCRTEAEKSPICVIALVPAVPGELHWHNHVWPHAYLVGFLRGRLVFVNPNGRQEQKGRGHALVVYCRDHTLAYSVLTHIGRMAANHPQEPVWVNVPWVSP
jgi:hypothetical protein